MLSLEFHGWQISIIRGLRNTSDFQAEMNYQTWLKKINPNLNIVNLFASPELIHVSSTAVLDMIETYGINHPLVKESLIF